MTTVQVLRNRTQDEVAEAIRRLSAADWARLQRAARWYAGHRVVESEDLLQEALRRAIDGRVCPGNVDVVRFVAETIRSVAHGELEKAQLRAAISVIPSTGPGTSDNVDNVRDSEPTPEERVLADADQRHIETEVLRIFDDDPIAREIVEGILAGLSSDEIQQLSGLDETSYQSKRRLIRRRIDKKFPQGWKS